MGRIITPSEIKEAKALYENEEISREELEDLVLYGSPSLWCETFLNDVDNPENPLVLREYQKEVIDSDADTICLVWGRQSGKTVALSGRMTWDLFTEPNITILFFAPKKKHLADVYNYMEKMIKGSPQLSPMLVSNHSSSKKGGKPKDAIAKIELVNGSRLLFFHTQSKVAREQIRGTRGDRIYMDEAHYVHEEALQAISGIITSAKGIKIWAQSTPRGKEGWFYEFHNDAELLSRRTSMESPDWTPEKEAMARLLAPDEGTFNREYIGSFTDDGWSAFTENSVQAAENNAQWEEGSLLHQGSNYLNTEEIETMPGIVYIGIDWNIRIHGVKIIVMKKPAFGKGRLIYEKVYSIESPTYTQTEAVDKLFEIVDEYESKEGSKVGGIAVDKGYAAGTVEMITKRMENPAYSWLKDKFHVIHFGELVHIPQDEFFSVTGNNDNEYLLDHSDEEFIKRPFKAFMVGVMTNMMLREELAIGPIDKGIERKTLLSELRRVKIEKIGANGYPVYTKDDLHKFAAAILCVFVYFLENAEYKLLKEEKKWVLRKSEKEEGDTTTWIGANTTRWWARDRNLDKVLRPNVSKRSLRSQVKEKRRKEGNDFDPDANQIRRSAVIEVDAPASMGWGNIKSRRPSRGRRSI